MYIIYTGILTLLCMILLHHIYNYLRSNLTIPKINDLKRPESKYIEINKVLNPPQMKDELSTYLKQFKKK